MKFHRKDVKKKSLIGGFFKVIGFVTVFCIFVGGTGIFLAGYWLQAGDEAELSKKADAIVVLGGSYFRPLYAADLYNQGFAPVIYVSRPIEPGWPLQNPPPVATSKSPTPVVVATGVSPPREGKIVSDRTGIIYSFFFPKASFSAASLSL